MFDAIALSSLAGIVFFHVIGLDRESQLRWPGARLDED